MVVLRHNRHEQHSAASMIVVEITLNDGDINLSKQYESRFQGTAQSRPICL
jgi:hypothetical protein